MKTKKILVIIMALAMIVSYIPTTTINALSVTPAQQASQTDDEKTSGEEVTEETAEEEDQNTEAEAGDEESSGPEEKTHEAADGQKRSGSENTAGEEPVDSNDAADADYTQREGVEGADVQGTAAGSRSEAAQALDEETSLSAEKIEKVVKRLFTTPSKGPGDDEEVPSSADGTTIENVTAKWMTTDSVDNGDPALLYVRPGGTSSQRVRLQINYALSGEIKYEPGDITITVPAHIFKDRSGKSVGELIVPYPEDPSKKSDYNWKQVGDKIIITNTKRMSAATKGYIQFEIDGISPQQMVDMAVSEPFTATLEVTTHKSNLIAKESNPLTAQFDTEARLTDTGKSYNRVTRVKASQIPENQRIEGEETYIKVDWYVWGTTSANTYYTIDQVDSIPQGSVVESRIVVADDTDNINEKTQMRLSDAKEIDPNAVVGGRVVLKTEADVKGFVIGGDSSDATSITKENAYRGASDGRGSYYYFSTAYPASQFEKDVNYTFNNTIKYTLTEVDPEVTENTNPNVQNVDPQKVTTGTRSASVTWSYTDPKWINPGGHFMVHKNGNDDTPENNRTHKSTYTYSDLHLGSDGYYGIYPSAINKLQDEYKAHGEDGSVRLSYTINTDGHTLPWMYDGGIKEFQEGKLPARMIGNYNRPVTMTTTDTGVSLGRNGEKLTVFEDYTFAEIEFPNEPNVYTGRPQNINSDGTWTALDAGDGTFRYTRDNNKTQWPDITLQLKRNGEWEDYAVASWKSGSRVITLKDGTEITNTGKVRVPEDTENFRTIVTTQNTKGGEDATEAIQAAINYDIRPVINLKSTEELIEMFEGLFAKSHLPQVAVYNSVNMLVERADVPKDAEDREIVSINREGYDSIRGYTTDTSVYPFKEATQNLREVDYENRTILIHYKARVEERSIINEKKTWQQAVDEGRLVSESSCTWRDLLPKGVAPDLSTIKLRAKDELLDAYTIEDYQESGRTLLVVKAKLTPVPQTYRSGDMTYYEDVPSISFDAVYDFESLKDYGYTLHNVISFESGNDTLGTITNYTGEPDDPYANKNISTRNAFKDDAEKRLMKDLDEDRDDPVFVYAGTTTKIDILNAARTSLYKDVQVNNDGIWSEGTYYRDIYEEEADKEATDGGRQRNVYEGGQYSYRLRVMSDPDTVSTGLILYDSLENFYAKGDPEHPEDSDNDIIDVVTDPDNDFHWHGNFLGVDTSQLEALGCAPVVYYSTIENLELSTPDDPDEADVEKTDLNNEDVWIKAEDYTGDLKDVKAIAVDCRRAKANAPAANKDRKGFFRLQPLQSAVALVKMQAPYGEEARDIIANKGVWGDSGMAYNNGYLLCTSLDEDEAAIVDYDEEIDHQFVHKDYTKVGLKENSLKATKIWNDDNDRDGIRPEKITFRLMADGKPVKDENGEDVIRELDVAAGETEVVFEHIPYTTPEGEKIHYTIVEDEVEGYTTSHTLDNTDYKFTNTHAPERTSIAGEKTWEGDKESERPASIDVELYANGEKLKTQTVKPAPDGTWGYTFTNLFKYENGKEIEYTVKEVKTPGTGDGLDSYVQTVDGFDMSNTYHPFGELDVTKVIKGTTEVSAENEFTFTFAFSKMQENDEGAEEEVPVFDEFDYEVLDENGEAVKDDEGEPIKGKVTSNSEITIKGGQTIHVTEIPEYIKYQVTENEVDGFTLTAKTGDKGTVKPNETAEAVFTNTYKANGQINLQAKKILENRTLTKYQFAFELYEVTVDDEGNEVEEIKSTASNDTQAESVLREDGTVDYSTATASFGVLRYTQEDHGKTYTYRIKEVDRAKDGYTYSTDIYDVDVKITDNGDGTLTIEPTYKDSEGNEVKTADFTNTYEAEGETTLQVWKNLPGRTLEEGEFTFELLDENGEPVVDEDGEAVTVTNNADGTAPFTPEDTDALKYDEKDIGKTFHYAIREVKGDDETVIYDKSVFGYEVKIVDNGDGTLYAEQTLATPVFDKDDPDKIVSWETEGAKLPVFENGLEDGGFSITKTTVDSEEADPTQEFRFRVRLIGDKVTDETITGYTITPVSGDGSDADSDDDSDANDSGKNDKTSNDNNDSRKNADSSSDAQPVRNSAADNPAAGPVLKAAAGAPAKALAQEVSDTYDGVSWKITTDGELILGNGGTQTMTYRSNRYEYSWPWNNATYRGEIKSVRINGKVIAQGSLNFMFGENNWEVSFPNLTEIDLTGMDTANVTKMEGMFAHLRALKTLNVTGFNTSQVTSMGNMFLDCTALQALDVTGFDTSRVTNMHYMFGELKSLTELDLSNWKTSSCTNFGYMFWGVQNVKVLDVSGFNTDRATIMNGMFGNCYKVEELNVSRFNTSNVTDLGAMFFECRSLEHLDVSHFNTSRANNLIHMWGDRPVGTFEGCVKLQELDLSNWNCSQMTRMDNMFTRCNSLKKVKLGSSFSFRGRNISTTSYQALLPKPSGDQYTGKWIREDSSGEVYGDAYTPENLRSSYASALAGTWVWQERDAYTVYFSAEGAAGGRAPAWLEAFEDQQLPSNTFQKPGAEFDYWAVLDGEGGEETGETYEDQATIPANTYKVKDKIYLKAVFKTRDTSVEMQDGEFEITLRAGEKATFDDIPAGTAYQIYEETPKGWILVEQNGVSGTIEPLVTSEASFVNKYEPGTVSVQLYATKTLDYKAAKAGAYTFVLKENGEELQRKETMDGGFIQFDPIKYKEENVGVHTYTIEEADPGDETIDWDTHKETVTVTVAKDGEDLVATTEYDSDGAKFSNMTRPGNLKLTKVAENATAANADDEFIFKITLNNADGMPLGSDDKIYWYTESNKKAGSDGKAAPKMAVKFTEPQLSGDSVDEDAGTKDSGDNEIKVEKRAKAGALKALAKGPAGDDTVIPDIFKPTTTEIKFTTLLPAVTASIDGKVQGRVRVTVFADGLCVMEPEDGVSGAYTLNGQDTNSGSASYGRIFSNDILRIITKFYVKGTCYAYGGCQHLFDAKGGDPKTMIKYADMRGMDVSHCTSLYEFMDYSDSLIYVDISTWEPPANCNMDMFLCPSTNPKDVIRVMKLNSSLRFRNWAAERIGSKANARWKTVEGNPAGSYTAAQLLSLYQNGNGTTATWVRENYNADYTVKFDANGGTGEIEAITSDISKAVTLPDADSEGMGNEDLICVGWSKNKNSLYPEYKAGDSFVGTPGTTTTMYAVWMSKDSYLIHFDGNGGYSSTQWKRVNSLDEAVELPTPTHPSNKDFIGWSTDAEGEGTMFTGLATGEELGAQPGETLELYAQWLDETKYGKYKVEHYRQNPGGGYSLYETDNLFEKRGATVSPEEKEYEGYLIKDHEAEYTIPAAGQPDLVVKYYYDLLTYEVTYDGNGATSGQMLETQTMKGGVQYELLANKYQKKGFIFTGWNTEADASGRSFVDKDKVKNLTKVNGETVTLYAQWMGNEEGELTPTNGEIIVKCKAGETIVIPDLPAGTTYTIEEIGSPAGWSQKGEIEGNGGTISANVTDQATATNTYKANGEAKINAHKILKGADIEEGQFTFELLDENGKEIDTKTNGEIDQNQQVDDEDGNLVDNPYYQTSLVEFKALEYTQEDIGKTYTYKIREKGEVQGVICDDLVADVSVHIEDAGKSILDVQVTYTNTTGNLEPIFENEMKKSQLKISKSIVDATDASENDEFTFTVNLKDSEGNAIEGEYDAEKGDETLTVKSGDTVTLKGGEEILIKGLPHGTVYEVTEAEKANWKMTASSGTTGTLEPGETSEASFENTYHEPEKQPYSATGSVKFTAKKKVEGGTILEDDGFTFELIDENGEVIQTKTCDKVSTDDEAVTESTITFDKIEYDLDDLAYDENKIEEQIKAQMDAQQAQYDAKKEAYEAEHADDPDAEEFADFNTWIRQTTGHTLKQQMQIWEDEARENAPREGTFTYYVREASGDDPDVDYDSSRYYYKVHAIDNGDGTIATDVKMYKPGDETDTEVDDITFVNSKTTQIKVYKRWVDNDDESGYRPTKEEFAEKIHLMAAVDDEEPKEVPDVQPTIREDADGNLTIIYEDLPAYEDGKKITYTVKEDEIAHYEAKDGQDEVEDGGTLMNVHISDKTDLKIIKKMDTRIDLPEEGENATIVFKITGKNSKGRVVYKNHVGMTFDAESGTFIPVTVKNIPVELELTVEEEYSGNYKPEGDNPKKVTLEPVDPDDPDGEKIWVVKFENTPTDDEFGSGIVNKYEYSDEGIKYKGKE